MTLSGWYQVLKLTPAGEEVWRIGGQGNGDGQFSDPTGLAVDGNGNVYVADTFNHRIQKFDSSGNFLLKWGTNWVGDGQFNEPLGLAVDKSDNIYVADTFNHRIQKFDSSGNFLLKWGSGGTGDGQFIEPWGVVVDGGGNVYVADTGNHRLQKFGFGLQDCALPGAGDWQVTEDCTIRGAVQASANVIVHSGVTLTIADGASLDIDFSSYHIRIKAGGRVIVRAGGRLH